jgi:hypothetical protein
MDKILKELSRVTEKANTVRSSCAGVTASGTLPAHDLATDLAQIGQEFINLSTQIRQANREATEAEPSTRPKWQPRELNAQRAADAIVRAGGYRVQA